MGKQTAVIEKSDSFLKVVLFRASGSALVVNRIFKTELDPRSTIGEILETADLSFDDMILVVPRNKVIVKFLDLPTADPKEIQGIVDIQAGRLTPFSKEEVIFGHETFPVKGGGSSKVLLGIAQQSVINTLVSQFRGGSVPVRSIVFGSECYALLSSFISSKISDHVFAVLDFDAEVSDFCVISGSKLLFTKLVHFGTHDLVHDHWDERLVEELETCFSEYNAQKFEVEFSQIILFNLSPVCSAAAQRMLSHRFQMNATACDEVLPKVSFSAAGRRGFIEAQEEGLSFSKLFAAAMLHDRAAIDFSPPNVKAERAFKKKRRELGKILMVFFLIIAVTMLIMWGKLFRNEMRMKSLNAQIAVLEAKAAPLMGMLKRIRAVEDSRSSAHSAMQVIRDVPKKVPEGVYLSEIIYVRGTVLAIRGTSRDNARVFQFVESLRTEPLFQDVQVKYVTKRNDVNDFEVSCLWAVAPAE